MNTYTITLLEYAQVKSFPATSIFSIGCPDNPPSFSTTYMIALLQNDDRNILIDCGYDINNPEALAHMKAEHHSNYISPDKVIQKTGLHPEDITDIILTHAHWDHMGGINFFPRANFYLQKKEYFMWKQVLALPQKFDALKGATKYCDFTNCSNLLSTGRLTLLEGNQKDLFPGIDIIIAEDGHSFASNMVLINTSKGKYLYTGDVAYVIENIVGINNDGIIRPNSYAIGSTYNCVKSLSEILGIVEEKSEHILICHDAKIWNFFNSSVSPIDKLHICTIG